MEDKIEWMEAWCKKQGLKLQLEGECGFGRECVGIVSECETFPDYVVYDENYDRVDKNGEVWTPEDAYHKHPCVAVLGRGEESVEQLYEWLQWFDANSFNYETSTRQATCGMDALIHGNKHHRMIRG